MNNRTSVNKIRQKSRGDSSQHSTGGEKATAMAPPDYGIDFVDSGIATTTPVQCVGVPEGEELLPHQFVAIQCRGLTEGIQKEPSSSIPAQSRTEAKSPMNNNGLPDNLKSGIESLSGISMDNVKVHYNSSQPAQLNALAYAQGNNIHLGPGQERHLPHEAWHVVQQAQGRVQPTMQAKGMAINNDAGLEKEADVMGEKALTDTTAQLQSAPSLGRVTGMVIQRVGLNDVDWDTATGVTRSGVGADGVYFVDFADGRLVVKLSSAPVEAVEKNQFLGDMGLNVPGSRAVTKDGDEGAQIHAQIEQHLAHDDKGEYDGNYDSASHFIIMENVPGESFRRVGGANLRKHLSDNNVLIAIGKQVIADAFLGIGDRLLVNQNPGNLMVDDNGTVYAIDNETHENHPVGNQINRIEALLNWDGRTTPQYMRAFAQRAAFNNHTNVQTVINLVSTKNARTRIKQGIRTGFDELVAVAREVPEDNHLHGISEDVIALAERRANQSKCYITTACMQYKGLDDNCQQLTVLRNFRDNYMAALPEGKQLISLYYQTAPRIVEQIEEQENRKAIYNYLYDVINECVSMIQNERNEEALSLYYDMVKKLARHFILRQEVQQNDRRTDQLYQKAN